MNAFGIALREARQAKGLTQVQLGTLLWPVSARSGLYARSCPTVAALETGRPARRRKRRRRNPASPFVSNLETGRKAAPSAFLAARIARALGLPPWHFAEALARDAMDATCTAQEVTLVIVGLRAYAQRCTAEEWAAIRAGAA